MVLFEVVKRVMVMVPTANRSEEGLHDGVFGSNAMEVYRGLWWLVVTGWRKLKATTSYKMSLEADESDEGGKSDNSLFSMSQFCSFLARIYMMCMSGDG